MGYQEDLLSQLGIQEGRGASNSESVRGRRMLRPCIAFYVLLSMAILSLLIHGSSPEHKHVIGCQVPRISCAPKKPNLQGTRLPPKAHQRLVWLMRVFEGISQPLGLRRPPNVPLIIGSLGPYAAYLKVCLRVVWVGWQS